MKHRIAAGVLAELPRMLLHEYWEDKAAGFPSPRYVGVREMEFY